MAAAPKFHVPPQLWWLATGPLRRGSPLGPSATARRRTLRCRPARRPPPRARGSPSPPPVCACARVAAAAAPSARLAATTRKKKEKRISLQERKKRRGLVRGGGARSGERRRDRAAEPIPRGHHPRRRHRAGISASCCHPLPPPLSPGRRGTALVMILWLC